MQHKDSIIPERNRGGYFNGIELDMTKVIKMSGSVEKEGFPDIILKRDNYEEWNRFIRRKLNEVPMMVDWIQGNQDAEQDFSVIPFQTRVVRLRQVLEPGTGVLVDQDVEEWHTHPAYLGEGPAIAQTVYKRISYVKEQDARKWVQQKEKGWKIIIDYLSLDIERDIQRIPQYAERMASRNVQWLWLEVRKIGSDQGSSSIARCMKKLESTTIEGEAWRAYFDEVLTSWNKIESIPGIWEEKFKEAFTTLFIEGVKTMKDPKMKLTAEISAQMARDRYEENWDLLYSKMGDYLEEQ